MSEIWVKNLKSAAGVLDKFLESEQEMKSCAEFERLLYETLSANNKVMTCGNGGSHCDAMHFAEELTGQFFKGRRALGAIALGDPSHVTCTANDYGFEHVFSRQVQGLGKKGDLLVGLSTSGNSQNVINAVNEAKNLGIKTVGLLGKNGGKLKDMVDVAIIIPADRSDRIQEMHIKLIHTVIESAERKLFPENY